MKKKLTLLVDEQVTERAKQYAHQQGTSVSDLVEVYLAQVSGNVQNWEPASGSVTASLLGIAREADHSASDYKEQKEKAIREKYG
jgi:antitoxin component of RelBE/YafQ-DinJ toxin-antitoxin module